ncbi:MAG: DoxX family protein [Candidatus Aquirickettsiella sp.]
MYKQAYSSLVAIAIIGMFLSLIILAFSMHSIPSNPIFFIVLLSLLGILALGMMYRYICIPFLFATFFVLSVLRILGLHKCFVPMIPVIISLLCLVILFLYIAYHDVKRQPIILQGKSHDMFEMSAYEWHLSFIRIYVGFDLIAHCTEKLFAGRIPFQADVTAFMHLNVVDPSFFVRFSGLCELAGVISLGLGLLTRMGALGTSLYLIVAALIGHHFLKGFIWALPGGGWEYPVMWSVFILSYIVLGADEFSIDGVLDKNFNLPIWLKRLMGVMESDGKI